MDYEKLHKDTITKLQEMVNSGKITIETARGICVDFVPESEDERIRKELLEHCRKQAEMYNTLLTAKEYSEVQSWIAWLEKHGRLMKALQISNAKIGELIEKNYYLKEQLEKQSEQKPAKEYNIAGIGSKHAEGKLGEMIKNLKSADKVESKFKIGDTVTVKPMSCHGKVFKGEPFKIVDIIEDNYVSDDGKTYSISLQDDWELVEQNPAGKTESKFKVKYAGSEYNVLEVKDIAGVTFYGIEDEPNHIDYVKAENCEIISGYAIKESGSLYPTKPAMFSEQTSAWSKEDERYTNIVVSALSSPILERLYNFNKVKSSDMINWLESLRERVHAQPQQEWSEEDESWFKELELMALSFSNDDSYRKKFFDWLKSIRPQNNITDEELAQAKKDAYNNALDKIEYHSGEPTFDDGWSAAIWYLKKRNCTTTWKPSKEQINNK